MSAYSELMEYLEPEEVVESIVFGAWGWGSKPYNGEAWELGYGEPEPPPVPFDKRGKLMPISEAEPMMQSWQFRGGYGAPDCYAVYIWTDRRVIWVTQYDGATGLSCAPRVPKDCFPDMPGG
jgi:hypothetical protein